MNRFTCKVLGYLIRFRLERWLFFSKKGWALLRRLRWKHMQRHLARAPYYRSLATKGAALTAYPVMAKAEFMSRFDDLNTAGIRKGEALALAQEAERTRDFSPTIGDITIGLSSGTTGSSGIFLASPGERARWVACVLDRVIGFSFRKRRVAFFLRANSNLYESARSRVLEFRFFDLMTPMEVHLKSLAAYQPHILVAQPSALRIIGQAIETEKLQIAPEKVISVAEVLTPEDRQWLEGLFGLTLGEVYQCTEGFLAASCKFGVLHFNEDFIHVEKRYLSDADGRFFPVITDLVRRTQPVIRYELNDVLREGRCDCGHPGMAIAAIEGRADDVLLFEGAHGEITRVFPDFIRRAIILAAPEVDFYTATQIGPSELEVCLKEKNAPAGPYTRERVAKSLGVTLAAMGAPHVSFTFTETYFHAPGTKLRRIRNAHSQTL